MTIRQQYAVLFERERTPFTDMITSMAIAAALDPGLLLYVYGRESSFGKDPHMGRNGPFQITHTCNPELLNVANPIVGAQVAIGILLGHARYWRYWSDPVARILASYNAGPGTTQAAAKWARTQPEGVTWREFPGRSPGEATLMNNARGYLRLEGITVHPNTELEIVPP